METFLSADIYSLHVSFPAYRQTPKAQPQPSQPSSKTHTQILGATSTVPSSQSTYKEYLNHTLGLTLSTPNLAYLQIVLLQSQAQKN